MSGNSHQRKVARDLLISEVQKLEKSFPLSSENTPGKPDGQTRQLGRGSAEAYAFFIVAGVYTVMSAFGSPVNFWAGCLMALVMAGCAIHLLWSSVWTANWVTLAKWAGSGIVIVTLLLVINSGYVKTHREQNPNAETLSAIQNLAGLVSRHAGDQQPIQANNTQVFDVDGKYPDISLSEPRDVGVARRGELINVDYVNVGSATAYAKRNTAALFIAEQSRASENAIFRFLYKREGDREEGIPVEDLAPRGDGIMPIGGEALREDGSPVTDADRTALMTNSKVMYVAALVSYQDRKGRMYHTELCFFEKLSAAVDHKCSSHNGHG